MNKGQKFFLLQVEYFSFFKFEQFDVNVPLK